MLSGILTPIMRSRFWDEIARKMRTDRFRRFSSAAGISVACHLIIVMAFLWVGNQKLEGQPSPSLDGGTADGDAAVMPLDLKLINGKGEAQSSQDASSASSTSALPTGVQPAATTMSVENASASVASEQTATSTAMPADTLADGQSDADQHILEQIARCLPQGVRPSLTARLNLQLDGQGNLAAAPSLDWVGSDRDTASLSVENSVVQAALQCGPYIVPNGGGTFAIAADFSKTGVAH